MPMRPRPIKFYEDENGCHICTSHKSTTTVNGKTMTIQQYVYRTKVGEIPEGKIVAHTCDNRRCINPDHLYLTTKRERYSNPIDFVVDPVKGCFNCTSHPLDVDGYPRITVNRKTTKLSRFVYAQMFDEIPEGLIVRHKCDNPQCINPEHLELGTDGDNRRDCVERDRQAKGSKNGTAKLTEEQVREIRKRLAAGERGSDLAREYGVVKSIISAIKLRKLWKHVD